MVSLPAREGKRNSFCARIARHLLNPKLRGVEQYVSTRFRSGKPGKRTRTARGGLLSGLLIAVRRMLESFDAQVPGHGSDCARSGSAIRGSKPLGAAGRGCFLGRRTNAASGGAAGIDERDSQ